MRLWDPNTGELISTLRGHTKGVWSCAFYPVGHTSALLATAGEDCTARLWDCRTRKVALTLTSGHADAVYSLAWSADGTQIATGSADRTVTIWDPKAGRVLKMFKGHEDTVKDCCFLPHERKDTIPLLVTAGGCSVNLWNPLPANNNLVGEVRHHDAGKEVECVHIAPNGKTLASGGRDGHINISSLPVFFRSDFEDRTPKDTHQEWRARIKQEQDEEFAKILERRGLGAPVKSKKTETPAPGAPTKPVNAQPELLSRWKETGLLSEDKDEPSPAAESDRASRQLVPGRSTRKDRPKSGAWGGTDWIKAQPEEDSIPEEDETEERKVPGRQQEPWQADKSDSRSKQQLAETVFPDTERPASIFGGKLKLTAPVNTKEQHPMVRTIKETHAELPLTKTATELPRKLSIYDGASLMESIRQKTDSVAYTSEAEAGRAPGHIVRRHVEPEPFSMEELMVKPKVSSKIRMRDTASISQRPLGTEGEDSTSF